MTSSRQNHNPVWGNSRDDPDDRHPLLGRMPYAEKSKPRSKMRWLLSISAVVVVAVVVVAIIVTTTKKPDTLPNALPYAGPNNMPGPPPGPGPVPGYKPAPGPAPADVPVPIPDSAPKPVPGPAPRPAPGPVPGPAPRPASGPVPGPAPRPEPQPAPGPFPADGPIAVEGYKSATGYYQNAAVAADSEPCSIIGRDILQIQKGSAVDAAIATLLCNGIHNSESTGIGGGFFMVVYDKKKGATEMEVATLDSREMTPLNAPLNITILGANTIGVPAQVRGYYEAWSQYGRLPWADLFKPAIKLCREGYRVGAALAKRLQQSRDKILAKDNFREIFTDTGDLLEEGDIGFRPQLANTLEKIALEGPETFYTGSLSKDLLLDLQDAGSIITAKDLETYKAIWRKPVVTPIRFHSLTAYSMPPPSAASVIPFMLNILDGYPWGPSNLTNLNEGITMYQRLVETIRFGFAKRSFIGDPAFADMDGLVNKLTSQAYADHIRKKITDTTTHDVPYYGSSYSPIDKGTTHVSLIAPDGSAVAITSSINSPFGSYFLGKRTGIIFNDQLDDFTYHIDGISNGLKPAPINWLEPGKRPLSSMSPILLFDAKGRVVMVIGGSGGRKIVSASTQVLFYHIWLRMKGDKATNILRLHDHLVPPMLWAEEGFNQNILEALKRMGHEETKMDDFAAIQSIVRECTNADCSATRFLAVSDGRKQGAPAGF